MASDTWKIETFAPTNPPPIVWTPEWRASPHLVFKVHALISKRTPKRPKTYWRHLHTDDSHMYVLPVELGRGPKNSLTPESWSLKRDGNLIGTNIQLEPELVCFDFMYSEMGEIVQSQYMEHFNKLSNLLSASDPIRLVTDASYRALQTAAVAAEYNVTPRWIRQLLTCHWYFGGHINAVMPLHKLKGGKGKSRFNITNKKMGTPNSSVKLNPMSEFRGVNMTEKYLAFIATAIDNATTIDGLRREKIIENFNALCVAHNLGPDGEVAQYPIAKKHLPSDDLIMSYANDYKRVSGALKRILHPADYAKSHATYRGNATDIVQEGESIVDFDGLDFNMHICRDESGISVGKPRIVIGVDRASHFILGFWCTLGSETSYGYRQAVYSCLTPKTEILAKYDVSSLEEGFAYGGFDSMFIDRGPGIARASLISASKNELDVIFARPGHPQGKGVIENINKIVQGDLSEMEGAYLNTKFKSDEIRKRLAPKNGIYTFNEFMQLFLSAVHDHNLFRVLSKKLSSKMLDDGVHPSPMGIYTWNQRYRDPIQLAEAEQKQMILNMFEERTCYVIDSAICIDKQTYTSPELKEFYLNGPTGPKGQLKSRPIVVYSFPDSNKSVIWKRGNEFKELVLSKGSEEIYGIGTQAEIGFDNTRRVAAKLESRAKEKRQLSNAKAKVKKAAAARGNQEADTTDVRGARKAANEELSTANAEGIIDKLGVQRERTPIERSPSDDLWKESSEGIFADDEDFSVPPF